MHFAVAAALTHYAPTAQVENDLTRSEQEIDGEVFALTRLLLHSAPEHDIQGQPVKDAIRAQIKVLSLRLTVEEAERQYEDHSLFIRSEALNAADWLCDLGEAPSVQWRCFGV